MLYFNIHVCFITEEKDCALIKLHLFNPVTIRHLCHVSKFTSFSLQIQLVTYLHACTVVQSVIVLNTVMKLYISP